MTGRDLDRLALTGRAGRWVAERSRAWLEFWRRDAGLDQQAGLPAPAAQALSCDAVRVRVDALFR